MLGAECWDDAAAREGEVPLGAAPKQPDTPAAHGKGYAFLSNFAYLQSSGAILQNSWLLGYVIAELRPAMSFAWQFRTNHSGGPMADD